MFFFFFSPSVCLSSCMFKPALWRPYWELRHVVSLLARSQCRQRCQLARHSDLSSYFNMFVSCMQMLSSQCLHIVLDSTRCVQPHAYTCAHTQSQTEIYCVISVAEGSRQIKEKKKRELEKGNLLRRKAHFKHKQWGVWLHWWKSK